MRLPTVLSLTACCGFLGFGVSAWIAREQPSGYEAVEITGFRAGCQWDGVLAEAAERDVPILVFATTASAHTDRLEQDFGSDAALAAALTAFAPVALRLDGDAVDRKLAQELGASMTPMFLVFEQGNEGPKLVDALEPMTGTNYNAFGLTQELLRVSGGFQPLRELRATQGLALARRLDCAGLFSEAAAVRAQMSVDAVGPGSTIRGYERLAAAIQAATNSPPVPADAESAIEATLLVESQPAIRYTGWTYLACQLERHAQASAASDTGEALGVPRERWERRLRETTRFAWISCPDELVLPFGALLIERYARVPKDLDSLDRAFMAAVIRTMAKAKGADSVHAQAWLETSRAQLPSR